MYLSLTEVLQHETIELSTTTNSYRYRHYIATSGPHIGTELLHGPDGHICWYSNEAPNFIITKTDTWSLPRALNDGTLQVSENNVEFEVVDLLELSHHAIAKILLEIWSNMWELPWDRQQETFNTYLHKNKPQITPYTKKLTAQERFYGLDFLNPEPIQIKKTITRINSKLSNAYDEARTHLKVIKNALVEYLIPRCETISEIDDLRNQLLMYQQNDDVSEILTLLQEQKNELFQTTTQEIVYDTITSTTPITNNTIVKLRIGF